MHIYIYIYIHIDIHIHIYIYMHKYMQTAECSTSPPAGRARDGAGR